MPIGGGGMGNIMKQAQKMQSRLAETQEKLKMKVVEATVGGGAVTCQANGHQEILSVKIKPEVVIEAGDAEDVEMLEELVIAAVNQALQKSQQLAQEEMSKVTGGMNIPGLF